MIITIFGEHGSGKSTVGELTAKELGYKFYSTGDLRGELAQDHGMTIDELNALNKKWTHTAIDEKTKEIGKTRDNIVLDSWLAWYFIPQAVKIFIEVDDYIAAERVFKNQRPDEPHQDTVEGVKEMLNNRFNVWAAQVREFYGIVDVLDPNHYNLIVDSSYITAKQVTKEIVDFVRKIECIVPNSRNIKSV